MRASKKRQSDGCASLHRSSEAQWVCPEAAQRLACNVAAEDAAVEEQAREAFIRMLLLIRCMYEGPKGEDGSKRRRSVASVLVYPSRHRAAATSTILLDRHSDQS